jgi:hypothetical protein
MRKMRSYRKLHGESIWGTSAKVRENNIKMDLKRSMSVWAGFILFRVGPPAGSCEHGSINGKECLNFRASRVTRD